MAAKIPLNKFRSIYRNINTNEIILDNGFVYEAPIQRAGILILCQVGNTTDQELTVSMAVSHSVAPIITPPLAEGPPVLYELVSDLVIPPKDARTLITGRLVLFGKDGIKNYADKIYFKANEPGLTLALGILETVNRD
jgi:hypothetical protein